MSANSVSGYRWNYQAAAASAPSRSTYATAASAVAPHTFGPNDQLNQYLTAEDRSTILSATGVDVRPNGEIMSPLSIGPNEYGAALDAIGQIAADRANGNLTGPISVGYFQKLMASFLDKLNNNLPEFGS